MAKSQEHNAWMGMRGRCSNPKRKFYARYGGRGIQVCERWINSFENFYADVGPSPGPTYSLDRYPDRDGDYEPGNVRWATKKQQVENRGCSIRVRVESKEMSLMEAADLLEIPYDVAYCRYQRRAREAVSKMVLDL